MKQKYPARFLKKILASLISLALIWTMFPPNAALAAEPVNVASAAEYTAALGGTGDIEINITGDFTITATTAISSAVNLTVNGNGHTITQTNGAQTLRLTGGNPTVAIKDLTISRSGTVAATDQGGAIYVKSGNLTVENVTISNCAAKSSGDGGAIYLSGGSVTVKDSYFTGNKAPSDGGAIYADSGSLTVTNSTFVNNTATSYGGAIHIESTAVSLNVSNSTFYGNSAKYGGAISSYNSGGAITNCTIVKNNAATYGGGVYNSNTSGSTRTTIKNCIIIGNTKAGTAGSTSNQSSGPDIYSAIEGGYNVYGYAHTSYFSKGAYSKNATAYPNNWLAENDPADNGGKTRTIALLEVAGSLAIDKLPSSAGTPVTDQRGVARDTAPDIGAFEFAAAPSATVTGVTVSPATASVQAGQTQQFSATVTVTGEAAQTVTWSVSGAESSDTGIDASGLLTVGLDESAGTLTVTATSTFDGTQSGTATVTVTEPPAAVTDVTVSPASASVQAGQTQQFSATVAATGGVAQTVTWSVSGGASSGTNINTSGLLTVGPDETAGTLAVTATSTFDSTQSGTAAVTVTPASAVTYAGTYAELASAVTGASADDVIKLTADIDIASGITIPAGKKFTIDGQGHTVKQLGTTPMFGAASGEITFVNIKFNGNGRTVNNGDKGGSAIYAYGSTALTVNIRNCEFTGCYTDGEDGGGAIYAVNGAAVLNVENSLFAGNRSTEYDGGAIYVNVKSGTIVNCTFTGNYAEYDGGAVVIYGGQTNLAITNCTFYGNTTWSRGGAIAEMNGSPSVIKNTIAAGNAVDRDGSQYQNAADVYLAYASTGSAPAADGGYNLFGKIGQTTSALSVASTSKKGVANSPAWLDATLRDNGGPTRTLALLNVTGSPAIDKIASGAPAYDQRGFDRLGNADIGAFEYGAVVTVSGVTLNKNALTLAAGQSETLSATIAPPNATNQSVTWESSDTEIATVDDYGAVTAIKAGNAVITVTTADGSKTTVCAVTVTSAPATVSNVMVSPALANVTKGESLRFTAAVTGENYPSQDVTWSVEGALSTHTAIAEDGTLSVGADETAAALTIKAVSTVDNTKYGTADVSVLSEFYVSSGAEFNQAMKSVLNPLIIHIEDDIDGVDVAAIAAAKTVKIYGDGHVIEQAEGGVTARMEAASGNRLEVYDLTIDGKGYAANYKRGGGAIYLAGGDVILENVLIKNCAVKYENDPNNQNGLEMGGGAVSVAMTVPYNSLGVNGSVTATNCAFLNNTVKHTYDFPGGGALSADKVYLTNCTFWGNKAEDSIGGAVYARLGGTMANCTVVNNSAIVGGGVTARHNTTDGNRGRIHLFNNIIAANKVDVDGVSSATASFNGDEGVNVDQVYDQGGNIIGYVHLTINSSARDEIYSANGSGTRVEAIGSIWNIPDKDADIPSLKQWLDYGEPKDNGGKTPTIALKDGSGGPAIDKGLATGASDVGGVPVLSAPADDQRGETRDSSPDIGAYEFTGTRTPAVVSVSVTPETATLYPGASRQFSASVSVWGNAPQTVTWSVSGGSSDDTKIGETGNLTVGADEEPATTLTVTATSNVDATKSGAATVTVTDPIDKSALTAQIAAAETALADAEIGEGNGQYPQAALDALESALAEAEAASDSYEATQQTIYAAANTLQNAIDAFSAARINVDYDELNDLIALCEALYGSAVEGEDGGQYEAGSKAEFLAAIETARMVANNDKAAQTLVDNEAEALETARGIFRGKRIALDYEGLNALIAAAETALADAEIGEGNGQYTQAALDALGSARAKAEAASDSDEATQQTIDAAANALQSAIDAFSVARVNVDYAELNDLIALCGALYGSAVEGEDGGQYEAGSKAEFLAAIEAAEAAASDGTATQQAIDYAAEALRAALETFSGQKNGVNYDILNALIEQARNKAETAQYGEGNGQYPFAAKDALEYAIAAAGNAADNDTATQQEISDAADALRNAVTNFNNAKITVNFSVLDAKLTEANAIQRSAYTEDSWNSLQGILGNAAAIRETEYVTQAEVDGAVEMLTNAINELEIIVIVHTVTFDGNGGTPSETYRTVSDGAAIGTLPAATPPAGYTLKGWYTEADGGFEISAVTIITGDIRVYAAWISNSADGGDEGGGSTSGGGGGGGSTTVVTSDDPELPLGEEPQAEELEEEEVPLSFISDHIQYLYGYEDGTIQPDRIITRAEAAAIFFRLLADSDKNAYVASGFTDLESGAWYYQAVAYLNSQGIITGYPDGTFRPNGSITRAEYATMASRFDELAAGSGITFYDVPNDHWAVSYVNSAAAKGWVSGFEDGGFRPENNVTRAQVVTIVNRMLGRGIALADIPDWAPKYTDLTTAHWAYGDIIEASCTHQYALNEAGSEIWIQSGVENKPADTGAADGTETDTDAGAENTEAEDNETGGEESGTKDGATDETNTDAEDDTKSAA